MVYCLSRSQPPFSTSAWETNDGPDRPVVIEKNPWAERESNPHSQRRLIYSQRSSPHCSICPRWVRCIQFYRPDGPAGNDQLTTRNARGSITSESMTGSCQDERDNPVRRLLLTHPPVPGPGSTGLQAVA